MTEDEYNSLKLACFERGGRNLSEFTRSELLAIVRSDSLGGIMQKRFSELDRKLSRLEATVEAIAMRLKEAPQTPSGLAVRDRD